MKLNCPRCGSHQVRPEPFRWYELLLALLFLHPFRCRRCQTRFIRSARVPRSPGLLSFL